MIVKIKRPSIKNDNNFMKERWLYQSSFYSNQKKIGEFTLNRTTNIPLIKTRPTSIILAIIFFKK